MSLLLLHHVACCQIKDLKHTALGAHHSVTANPTPHECAGMPAGKDYKTNQLLYLLPGANAQHSPKPVFMVRMHWPDDEFHSLAWRRGWEQMPCVHE